MTGSVRQAVSRRVVLSGALAASALPAWARILPTNPDVVVIEGARRIGGRAWTETDIFGV